jgi:hypothetical protein
VYLSALEVVPTEGAVGAYFNSEPMVAAVTELNRQAERECPERMTINLEWQVVLEVMSRGRVMLEAKSYDPSTYGDQHYLAMLAAQEAVQSVHSEESEEALTETGCFAYRTLQGLTSSGEYRRSCGVRVTYPRCS